MTLKISRSQVSTQPNPTQPNPWMDPTHDQLWVGDDQSGLLFRAFSMPFLKAL